MLDLWQFAPEPMEQNLQVLHSFPQSLPTSTVDPRVKDVSIRPIGAGPRTENNFNSPVHQAIAKGLAPLHFSGRDEEWAQYVKEWGEYIRHLSPSSPIADPELLLLFQMTLPSHMKKEIDFVKSERGGKITFLEAFQHFDNLFGKNLRDALRRRLREIQLSNSGKITPQQWREFEIDFKNCVREMPDMGKEDICESLRGKLLSFMATWVVDREIELNRTSPIVTLQMDSTMAVPGVLSNNFQRLLGVAPRSINVLGGGKFEVHLENVAQVDKMMSLNGKFLVGSTNPIIVRSKEQSLGVTEIFEVVREKLEARHRVDNWNGQKNGSNPTRQTRSVEKSEKNEEKKNRRSVSANSRKGSNNEKAPEPTSPSVKTDTGTSKNFPSTLGNGNQGNGSKSHPSMGHGNEYFSTPPSHAIPDFFNNPHGSGNGNQSFSYNGKGSSGNWQYNQGYQPYGRNSGANGYWQGYNSNGWYGGKGKGKGKIKCKGFGKGVSGNFPSSHTSASQNPSGKG